MPTRLSIRRLAIAVGVAIVPTGVAVGICSWLLQHPSTQEYERGQQGCPVPIGKRVGLWVGAYKNKDEVPFLGLDGYHRYKDTHGQIHSGTLDQLMPIISADRGFWGLQYDLVPQGVVVLQVVPGLPAATAGLLKGDVITKWGDDSLQGKPIAELRPLLALHPPRTLTISRGSKELKLLVGPNSSDAKKAG